MYTTSLLKRMGECRLRGQLPSSLNAVGLDRYLCFVALYLDRLHDVMRDEVEIRVADPVLDVLLPVGPVRSGRHIFE